MPSDSENIHWCKFFDGNNLNTKYTDFNTWGFNNKKKNPVTLTMTCCIPFFLYLLSQRVIHAVSEVKKTVGIEHVFSQATELYAISKSIYMGKGLNFLESTQKVFL